MMPAGSTLLQAAQALGIEVPLFCYHQKLSIAGNCRMCLVQVEGQKKPVASCAMPVAEGMKVHTNTPYVQEARKGALEFLLINHPLDCPICDQGGECDLQDITVAYGKDKSRFSFYKRAVQPKDFGPLIKTDMNRCIHCTRCVRFATEVAGIPHMGAVGRGEHTEIVSMLGKPFDSELSGNVIDLCPVGALTSKSYAYKARPWELEKTESIDVMDPLGAHIRIDTVHGKVLRILPRVCEEINEEWLSDVGRFACDGLSENRLDRPYVRGRDGILHEVSWEDALVAAAEQLQKTSPSEIAALAGDLVDVESLFLLKKLLSGLQSDNMGRLGDAHFNKDMPRCGYVMNTPIHRFEEADLALLVGVNLRHEAPLLNARLRKAYAHGQLKTLVVGNIGDLGYPTVSLGDDPRALLSLANGTHPMMSSLVKAQKPLLIVGQDVLSREDGLAVWGACYDIATKTRMVQKDWCGFNVLWSGASGVGSRDIGFGPQTDSGKDAANILQTLPKRAVRTLYLMGADPVPPEKLVNTFVIYQGHHGSWGAEAADVILPGRAYTEKTALYVNAEGRPQTTLAACAPPCGTKEDWTILNELAKKLTLESFSCQEDVRKSIQKSLPFFNNLGILPGQSFVNFKKQLAPATALNKTPVHVTERTYLNKNIITQSSATMRACEKAFINHAQKEDNYGMA